MSDLDWLLAIFLCFTIFCFGCLIGSEYGKAVEANRYKDYMVAVGICEWIFPIPGDPTVAYQIKPKVWDFAKKLKKLEKLHMLKDSTDEKYHN